jgi:hypothetical protein
VATLGICGGDGTGDGCDVVDAAAGTPAAAAPAAPAAACAKNFRLERSPDLIFTIRTRSQLSAMWNVDSQRIVRTHSKFQIPNSKFH